LPDQPGLCLLAEFAELPVCYSWHGSGVYCHFSRQHPFDVLVDKEEVPKATAGVAGAECR